jgi:divalent metal cation (Fe/Co/Zn/Cd) transporter
VIVVLAAVSVVALTAIALRKRYIAVRLPSDGLRADGNLSAVGATLAGVTVVGTGMAEIFDWWWADPLAALLIACGAIVLGVRTWPLSESPKT